MSEFPSKKSPFLHIKHLEGSCEQLGVFVVTSTEMAHHFNFSFEFSALKNISAHCSCQTTPSSIGTSISIGGAYASNNIISGLTTSGFNVAVSSIVSGWQTSVYWSAEGYI